ncbi:13968_t:CDS:2 [Funneliformis caledonium]|uniref:13968_t:CDS:1 n=1 Tax=Funneliformis caledonium TaxID=1117310 RepID=A0A9N9I0J6_9GLOM|nr:13968_t:CDS:2 [Funneliformis caledonium]
MSDELGLTTLIQHILQYLIENQSFHLRRNPLKFLQTLSCHENEIFSSLKDYSIEIICEDPVKFLFNSPDFLLLDKSILISILIQDFLDVKDEVQIWNHVLKWGISQMPSSQFILKTINNWTREETDILKEILSDFIPLIRWLDISLNDVMNKVAPYSNILPKDFCREIFNAHRSTSTTSESTLLNEFPLINYIESLPPRFPLNSLLITPKKVSYLASWIDKEKKNYYSCDNLLIGGYNPLDWKPKYDSVNGNSMYQTENSFLFCFGKGEKKDKSGAKDGNPVVKSKISKLIRVSNPQKAIYYSPVSGPCFGGGCDLGIINNQIVSYGSLSYNGINKFIKEESHLDLEDYEVFQVVKSE